MHSFTFPKAGLESLPGLFWPPCLKFDTPVINKVKKESAFFQKVYRHWYKISIVNLFIYCHNNGVRVATAITVKASDVVKKCLIHCAFTKIIIYSLPFFCSACSVVEHFWVKWCICCDFKDLHWYMQIYRKRSFLHSGSNALLNSVIKQGWLCNCKN